MERLLVFIIVMAHKVEDLATEGIGLDGIYQLGTNRCNEVKSL